jgi:predicted nuclease with TOPRIM domain|tara:strand:+ start:6923 stop:7285 length:363 start_codon:yes stop_codon:yes gene_type:complete
MEFINEYFKVFQFVMWGVFAVIVFALTATFPKKKEHAELKERVKSIEETYNTKDSHTQLSTQVNTLETQFKELPDNKTIHRLEKELGELKGSVDGFKDQLKIFTQHVSMLLENELRGNDK